MDMGICGGSSQWTFDKVEFGTSTNLLELHGWWGSLPFGVDKGL